MNGIHNQQVFRLARLIVMSVPDRSRLNKPIADRAAHKIHDQSHQPKEDHNLLIVPLRGVTVRDHPAHCTNETPFWIRFPLLGYFIAKKSRSFCQDWLWRNGLRRTGGRQLTAKPSSLSSRRLHVRAGRSRAQTARPKGSQRCHLSRQQRPSASQNQPP